MKRAAAALLLSLGLVGPAAAQDVESFRVRDAASLARLCSTAESHALFGEARQFCYGFIAGAGSMYRETVAAGAISPTICTTREPTLEQIRMALVDWIGRNPDAGKQSAVDALFRAAAATWPCDQMAKPQ
jgi:hypothetical protein